MFGLPIDEREVYYFAVVILTMAAYGLYRRLKPAAPKYHSRFIVAAILLCLGVVFIYQHYVPNENGVTTWLICSALGYGVYRLVQRAPEKRRKPIAIVIVLLLSSTLVKYGYHAHYIYHRSIAPPPYCNEHNIGMNWNVSPPSPSIITHFFPVKVYDRCVPKPEEQKNQTAE